MSNIKLFESKKIRSQWDAEQEKWVFSIIDVIEVLTDSPRPRKYWSDLKAKLKKEGSQLSDIIGQLKLQSEDGKMYVTDVADTEQLFRLIQSIPSPKAEPFKQWLAKIGYERVEESQDPEKTIDRAMENYFKLGYSKEWINQRLKSIEVRKDLIDIITQAWSGKTVKQFKEHKNLKKENLRDNMINLELVLNMLAEATTTEISKEKKPKDFIENKIIAKQGGTIAGNTRKAIEAKSGKKIVSPMNAKKVIENKEGKK